MEISRLAFVLVMMTGIMACAGGTYDVYYQTHGVPTYYPELVAPPYFPTPNGYDFYYEVNDDGYYYEEVIIW